MEEDVVAFYFNPVRCEWFWCGSGYIFPVQVKYTAVTIAFEVVFLELIPDNATKMRADGRKRLYLVLAIPINKNCFPVEFYKLHTGVKIRYISYFTCGNYKIRGLGGGWDGKIA